jgi:hybrid cluster-associated redox disulfide protein
MHDDPLLSLTVSEIMNRWPQCVPVFLAHKLDCVGCPMAPFETLAEVIEIYRLSQDDFLAELAAAIYEEKTKDERQK